MDVFSHVSRKKCWWYFQLVFPGFVFPFDIWMSWEKTRDCVTERLVAGREMDTLWLSMVLDAAKHLVRVTEKKISLVQQAMSKCSSKYDVLSIESPGVAVCDMENLFVMNITGCLIVMIWRSEKVKLFLVREKNKNCSEIYKLLFSTSESSQMGSKKEAMQIRPAIMRKSLSFVHSGTRSEECFTEWKFFSLNESHLEQTTSFMDKVKCKFHLAIFYVSWAFPVGL